MRDPAQNQRRQQAFSAAASHVDAQPQTACINRIGTRSSLSFAHGNSRVGEPSRTIVGKRNSHRQPTPSARSICYTYFVIIKRAAGSEVVVTDVFGTYT